jgi:Ferredoxin subunits of nitrite reductase and ring-hydroxylating dioxygenases
MTGAARANCFDLGPLDRIPLGEGRTFRVGERDVAVFNTRTGIFATDALCPHRAGRLADGLVGGGKVICPLHARMFALDTGQPVGNDCPALTTYRTHVTNAMHVELWIDDGERPDWSPAQ